MCGDQRVSHVCHCWVRFLVNTDLPDSLSNLICWTPCQTMIRARLVRNKNLALLELLDRESQSQPFCVGLLVEQLVIRKNMVVAERDPRWPHS
jgi:hypothetical protein